MANLDIWDRLARTDPKHTKSFNRPGGFKGTAVKPIYTEQKMTEVFGPCGIGWGISEPTFQLVNGADGEIAVYSWLTVWYRNPATGEKSEPIPGVGGDMAVKKHSSKGTVLDDEAFKKATTDAIGNAMKHVGMSADIHMGQHDDDKYVSGLRREIEAEGRGQDNQAPAPPPPPTAPQLTPVEAEWAEWAKARAAEYKEAPTLDDLEFAIKRNISDMGKCASQAPRVHTKLNATITQRRAILAQAPGKAA